MGTENVKNLEKEFWGLFVLESRTIKERKETKNEWEKDQKKREGAQRIEFLEVEFKLSHNYSEINAKMYVNKNGKTLEMSGKKISISELIEEMVSTLSIAKMEYFKKYLIALRKKEDNERLLEEILLGDYYKGNNQNKIEIDWDLSDQATKFWHYMNLKKTNTIYTEEKQFKWERKEGGTEPSKSFASRKQEFVF